jgi:hypothetical protein
MHDVDNVVNGSLIGTIRKAAAAALCCTAAKFQLTSQVQHNI